MSNECAVNNPRLKSDSPGGSFIYGGAIPTTEVVGILANFFMNKCGLAGFEARMLQHEVDKFHKDLASYYEESGNTSEFIVGYLCALGFDVNEIKANLGLKPNKKGICQYFYVENNREGPASSQCHIEGVYSCCTKCSMHK